MMAFSPLLRSDKTADGLFDDLFNEGNYGIKIENTPVFSFHNVQFH